MPILIQRLFLIKIELSKADFNNRLFPSRCRTRHKQYKKRTTTRIAWFLGSDNLSISVGVYNIIRKSPPLSTVMLERKSNIEVSKKRAQHVQGTNQLLMPFDMKYCAKIMGKSINFEKEEINKMRSIVDPGS